MTGSHWCAKPRTLAPTAVLVCGSGTGLLKTMQGQRRYLAAGRGGSSWVPACSPVVNSGRRKPRQDPPIALCQLRAVKLAQNSAPNALWLAEVSEAAVEVAPSPEQQRGPKAGEEAHS